ncbi:MAG: two-component system, cell cycle response regulator [Acidimicrobiaceae bacterium]|nr:two-component system, cell cycle response regulator [Acidimicrobiaceae bacterium]
MGRPDVDVVRKWLVGERGAAGTSVGGRLGSAFFMIQGFTVAGTAWAFPHAWQPLLVFSAATLVVGVAVRALPWDHWPQPTLMGFPLAALALLGVTGYLAPGVMPAYLALYSLSYVYVGLTQPPGFGVLLTPAAMLSYAVASHGGHGGTVVAATSAAVAMVTAELLAVAGLRGRETEAGLGRVIDAARAMARTDTVAEACEVLAGSALGVFSADFALVFLADPTVPYRYISTAAAGLPEDQGPIAVNIAEEQTGVGVAVRGGERLFVRDVAESPLISSRVNESIGARSLLFLPLIGQNGAVGALVIGWSRRLAFLDPIAVSAAEVLSAESGWVLERLGITARLAWEAENDPLTCLPNRRVLNRALGGAKPGDALVVIDLDHFKKVNDEHGHAAGDETLRLMADCLRAVTREGDCAARMGGEEFAVVLSRAAEDGASSVLRRLREAWARREPLTTFSAGVAVCQPGEGSVTTLGRADAALYEAKRAGRDCIRVG